MKKLILIILIFPLILVSCKKEGRKDVLELIIEGPSIYSVKIFSASGSSNETYYENNTLAFRKEFSVEIPKKGSVQVAFNNLNNTSFNWYFKIKRDGVIKFDNNRSFSSGVYIVD